MKPITTQELRIGNYYQYKYDKEILKVTGLVTIEVDGFPNGYVTSETDEFLSKTSISFLKPVELTEEILLRLGFENGVIRINEKWDDYYLKIDLKTDCIDNCVYGSRRNGMNFPYTIKYVHELQNLFYSLTGGKELELKPKQ